MGPRTVVNTRGFMVLTMFAVRLKPPPSPHDPGVGGHGAPLGLGVGRGGGGLHNGAPAPLPPTTQGLWVGRGGGGLGAPFWFFKNHIFGFNRPTRGSWV